MQEKNIVMELNQLLKGSHMGASIFEDLRSKLKSKELNDVFDQILGNFNMHERALTALIISENGEPVDTAGVMGTVQDIMYSLKNLALLSDEDVLRESLKSMEMAIKAINDFDDKHFTLNENMDKTIRIMQDDYKSIYHMLHKYLTEYRKK